MTWPTRTEARYLVDAERLRIERARQRLTVRQLAEKAGVNPGTISELERGVRQPYPATLGKIAAALDIPVEELTESPLAQAPPSLEPSLNDVLGEERRFSMFADTLSAVANRWADIASRPDTPPLKRVGFIEAALDLVDHLSRRAEDTHEYLSNQEKRQLLNLLGQLNEVAARVVGQLEHPEPLVKEAERREEMIRELTRRISA